MQGRRCGLRLHAAEGRGGSARGGADEFAAQRRSGLSGRVGGRAARHDGRHLRGAVRDRAHGCCGYGKCNTSIDCWTLLASRRALQVQMRTETRAFEKGCTKLVYSRAAGIALRPGF